MYCDYILSCEHRSDLYLYLKVGVVLVGDPLIVQGVAKDTIDDFVRS